MSLMPFKNKEDYNSWKKLNYLKHRDAELLRKQTYHKTAKGRDVLYQSIKAYRQRFPERQRARQILQYHLRKGKVVKLPCRCGARDVQAHHPDYSKPLEVVWLCSTCHGEAHRLHAR